MSMEINSYIEIDPQNRRIKLLVLGRDYTEQERKQIEYFCTGIGYRLPETFRQGDVYSKHVGYTEQEYFITRVGGCHVKYD